MTDESQSALPLETPAAVSLAPVAAVQSPAVVDNTPEPVAVTSAAPVPVPVIEAASPTAVPSVLGAEPESAKPADAPIDKQVEAKVENKPAEATTETPVQADVVVLPAYEPFTLPEGMTASDNLNDFAKQLAEFEVSKPDHAKFQEFGQKLVDSHVEALNTALTAQTDYFIQLNERQKASDLEALRKDPVIGKGGDAEAFQAFGKDFVNFIARNGGTKEEVTAFREFTKERGVDNALPIIRVINNLKNKIERYEKEASSILPGTKPAVAAPQHPGKGMTGRLYGGGK